MSSRCSSRFRATAIDPKTDSRKTQNMIDPSSPPQYERELVEERLRGVGVVLDVLDGVVAGR